MYTYSRRDTPIKKILEIKQTTRMNIVTANTTQRNTRIKKLEKTDDMDEKR